MKAARNQRRHRRWQERIEFRQRFACGLLYLRERRTHLRAGLTG